MALPSNCKRISVEQRNVAAKSIRNDAVTEPYFAVYDDAFLEILGRDPSISLIASQDYMFAHEAPVYIPDQETVFFTSNTLRPKPDEPVIDINKIQRNGSDGQWTFEKLSTGVAMGNGAINGPDGYIIFCDQGSLTHPGGIVFMETEPPYNTITKVDGFHGKLFNSVNDVVTHTDGSVWWTDPTYGLQQGFRGEQQLPCMVYRWDPKTGDVRAVADQIGMPNGLCFSPDEKTMYITDTHQLHAGKGADLSDPSTIYAYDVQSINGGPFLTNRRLFAFADHGIPDGIKCDDVGNVYSGCGDGLNVWAPDGRLIGKVMLPDDVVANFCFARKGEIVVLNEHKIWLVKISEKREGALLKNLGVPI